MEEKDLQELRDLVGFLKDNGIAEFDLHRGEQHVRIKFAQAAVAPAFDAAQLQHFAAASAAAHAPAVAAPVTHAPAPVAAPEEKLHEVKSPIVGTFYESSAPGAAAFVKVGDIVEVGQVLCIVEAMKLMNEIESDVAGEVVKIIAKNGQAVEYGLPLFAVRPR
ncbi:acetyl-CoA carboxylase, biotin carboxyl carrier protein [Terriglobus roseus DSM 18391]|uniref:Biotin carboxyl carrier protein of acetyl-CoA carboxylase n=1 Tax=Terriglobus roseus (strain DSM 18391 / NRRL B-41598 / KBS 63) TaxID=926566 RepID=I3ZFM4_TERRK|nr:acetyl-CoA carboxylase biotin carboxyl carrier protein [Terriglobus roseus]AFL88042.1 acetyl-CoA carboxylase, biotin carboxyl carrier protein [Terriglobus roseus DSM 18391]